jgi:hypothetical protein
MRRVWGEYEESIGKAGERYGKGMGKAWKRYCIFLKLLGRF